MPLQVLPAPPHAASPPAAPPLAGLPLPEWAALTRWTARPPNQVLTTRAKHPVSLSFQLSQISLECDTTPSLPPMSPAMGLTRVALVSGWCVWTQPRRVAQGRQTRGAALLMPLCCPTTRWLGTWLLLSVLWCVYLVLCALCVFLQQCAFTHRGISVFCWPCAVSNPPTTAICTVSSLQVFGYPTGLGALVVKRSLLPQLHKRYAGGGTVEVALAATPYAQCVADRVGVC